MVPLARATPPWAAGQLDHAWTQAPRALGMAPLTRRVAAKARAVPARAGAVLDGGSCLAGSDRREAPHAAGTVPEAGTDKAGHLAVEVGDVIEGWRGCATRTACHRDEGAPRNTIPDHNSLRMGTLAATLGEVATHAQPERAEVVRRLFG